MRAVSEPDGSHELWRFFRNGTLSVVAFLSTCFLLHAILPVMWMQDVNLKLDHVREHGADYDLVLVGSSRVLCQVSPKLFDATAAALGVPCVSFNAGVGGLVPPESTLFLERLLAQKAGRLRWAIVELLPVQFELIPRYRNTVRGIYWHELSQSWPLIRAGFAQLQKLRHSELDPRKKSVAISATIDHLRAHLSLTVQNYSNRGRAAAILSQRFDTSSPDEPATLGPDADGFTPANEDATPAERERISKAVANLQRRNERSRQQPDKAPGDLLFHHTTREIARLDRQARAAGVQIVWFVPPYIKEAIPDALIQWVRDHHLPVLVFNDPAKFPELYQPDNRRDLVHLNQRGALQFTPMVAQQFVETIRPN